MVTGIDPELERKRNRVVREVNSARDGRSGVEDALDDIEDAFDDFKDEVDDLEEYNQELYDHTVELYELTEDLADTAARRDRQIDHETEIRLRDITNEMSHLADNMDVDDGDKRDTLRAVATGALIAGGAMSIGAVGNEALRRGYDRDDIISGRPEDTEDTARRPSVVGKSLDLADYDFNMDIEDGVGGFASWLSGVEGDREDIDYGKVRRFGSELDDKVDANTPKDWKLGFKDDFTELLEDGESYDSGDWGVIHLYDPSPGHLKLETVFPQEEYDAVKTEAKEWVEMYE